MDWHEMEPGHGLTLGGVLEKIRAWRHPRHMVELVSAAIVILAVLGLILGIMAPGKITGSILPLALISWFILYKMMDQK